MTDTTETTPERKAPKFAKMSGAELEQFAHGIRKMSFTPAYNAKQELAYDLAQLKINDVRAIRQRVENRRQELKAEYEERMAALAIIDGAIQTVLS